MTSNKKVRVSIIGASGYSGGELIRLLSSHPNIQLDQVTSERFAGKAVSRVHPNLRKVSDKKFVSLADLESTELVFLCLPHGASMEKIDWFADRAERIIDLSADFRLDSPARYQQWYKEPHSSPAYLEKFVYGIPELHREEMRSARFISSAGCNATTTILGIYPLFKHGVAELDRTVVEVKVGSSEGGNSVSEGSHHPERSGCVRSFMPTGHRHSGEIEQELAFNGEIRVHMSATSIDMVRGVLATSHVFLNKEISEKEIWQIYREEYHSEPFMRIVKEARGIYRYPEPKLLVGSNYCDVGFELDPNSNRLVVISAIDNLMKGASGQAVQAMNIMYGFEETLALEFSGLHPI